MADNNPQPGPRQADHHQAPPEGAQAAGAAPDEGTGAATPPEAEAPAAAEAAETPAAEEAELSPEELLRRERDELKERWLRTAAELENYRKRTRKEMEDVRQLAVAGLLRDLLEVLDNFERAVISMRNAAAGEGELESLKAGVGLIYQRFRDILLAQGLERIDPDGGEFDPALHEAILQLEKEGLAPGQIAEVVQPGYRLKDLVIRPARVIVAS